VAVAHLSRVDVGDTWQIDTLEAPLRPEELVRHYRGVLPIVGRTVAALVSPITSFANATIRTAGSMTVADDEDVGHAEP